MSEGYWHKGVPKDPDHGRPYRRTLAKIALLMPYLDGGDRETVLDKIAETRPDLVLGAMCAVMDDAEEILGQEPWVAGREES